MDLTAWWADPTRAKALLDLIEELPTACRWREALQNDDEYARRALAAEDAEADPEAPPPAQQLWTPRWSDFDLKAMQNREVINLLQAIGKGLGVIDGGTQFPSPATALDRLRQEQATRDTAFIIAQLLGR